MRSVLLKPAAEPAAPHEGFGVEAETGLQTEPTTVNQNPNTPNPQQSQNPPRPGQQQGGIQKPGQQQQQQQKAR